MRQAADFRWGLFFISAIVLWGLFPRLVFWGMSAWKERKELAGIEFLEKDHRRLWRDLRKVEHAVALEGAGDGVVVLDVGGIGIESDLMRPFFLRVLRVNPEKWYQVSVMDEAMEREAWKAVEAAPCGVVLVVEAWNLSPKEMKSIWQRLRDGSGQEAAIRFLVVGEVRGEKIASPNEEEFAQWQQFVDDLRDPSAEAVIYSSEE